MAIQSYSERYRALCEVLDTLPSPSSNDLCHFQSWPESSDSRSAKLDHFLPSSRSRKGKEVERFSHVNELRLSEQDFDNLGQLGDGQFGSVSAVRCKLDGQVYAMKTVKKYTAVRASSQMNLPLERHIHILARQRDHHHGLNAPEMIVAFQTDSALHLITTYAAHGTLWDRMCGLAEGNGETSKAGRMAEDEIRWWGSQMIAAIEWLHGQGFVHRDIKPHNFLIHSPSQLSLTDFGSAAQLTHPPSPLNPDSYIDKRFCMMPIGTPDYIAPEILKMAEDAMMDEFDLSEIDPDKTVRPGDHGLSQSRGYGPDVDWWSFGATMYEMATGEAPFYAKTVRETYESITRCGEGTYKPDGSAMSPELRSICLSLLTMSEDRLGRNADGDVINHPFFAACRTEGSPPIAVLSLPVIELDGRGDPTDTSEATFDHLFQSSVGMTVTNTTLTTSCSSVQTAQLADTVPDRWCGWTWLPPADAFPQSHNQAPVLRSTDRLVRPLPRHIVPVTPARTTASLPAYLPTTTPRSTLRKRPVSDKRAMAELFRCVQHSARKRASSVKPRITLERDMFEGAGARREVWTPTPKPRPPLAERGPVNAQKAVTTEGLVDVEVLAEKQVRLEDGLVGLERRLAKLKSRLQGP